MSALTHAIATEIQFGSDPNHATFVSVKALALAPDTVEIRFETTFTKAKDPLARQTKSQHFMSTTDLRLLRDRIDALLSAQSLTSGSPAKGDQDA